MLCILREREREREQSIFVEVQLFSSDAMNDACTCMAVIMRYKIDLSFLKLSFRGIFFSNLKYEIYALLKTRTSTDFR